jgi:hypothetical protein
MVFMVLKRTVTTSSKRQLDEKVVNEADSCKKSKVQQNKTNEGESSSDSRESNENTSLPESNTSQDATLQPPITQNDTTQNTTLQPSIPESATSQPATVQPNYSQESATEPSQYSADPSIHYQDDSPAASPTTSPLSSLPSTPSLTGSWYESPSEDSLTEGAGINPEDRDDWLDDF